MNPQHKIWWEELADQYEEWAENPPGVGYTCVELSRGDWGFGECTSSCDFIAPLWEPEFGKTRYPAHSIVSPDRDEKRFALCWYMAETIRDELKKR